MNLNINGDIFVVESHEECLSLDKVLSLYDAKPPFAIAVNGDFVPQSDYGTRAVDGNDLIDIVSPIFGG